MDDVGLDYVVVSDVKMWSYRSHFQVILDVNLETMIDIVQRGRCRIIGGVSYNPFRIEDSLWGVVK